MSGGRRRSIYSKRVSRGQHRYGADADWATCTRWGAHWRNLTNTTEPSVCGGDAAFDHLLNIPLCFIRVAMPSGEIFAAFLINCGKCFAAVCSFDDRGAAFLQCASLVDRVCSVNNGAPSTIVYSPLPPYIDRATIYCITIEMCG